MINIIRERYFTDSIDDLIHTELPINQVYVRIIHKEENIIIVSKDGTNRQLPGGKPEMHETIGETGIREVGEETGISLSKHKNDIHLFGFYKIQEEIIKNGEKYMMKYLQCRMYVRLDEIDIIAERKIELEDIKYSKIIKITELENYIPWLIDREEYKFVTQKKT